MTGSSQAHNGSAHECPSPVFALRCFGLATGGMGYPSRRNRWGSFHTVMRSRRRNVRSCSH